MPVDIQDGKDRLVGTVKNDIMKVNEVAWPVMVAGAGHTGDAGLYDMGKPGG